MISPHFPPDTSAGTHRVRLLAPHLPAFGWEPTVMTIDPSAYEGRLDADLAELVPRSLRVVRVPAWSPRMTRTLGIGDLGLRSLAGLRAACDRLLTAERFDALFITVYPTYPALLGPYLRRRHRVPFVLDYQDPWVGAWGLDVGGGRNGRPDLKSRLTRLIAQGLEPPVVRAADGITAVSARTYEDVLARVGNAQPRACADIPIGFDERDLEALRRSPRRNRWFDSGDGLVHLCYVGTVLPKGLSVLRAVLAAVRELRRQTPLAERLRLHFLGTSNQRDESSAARVLPLARDLGIADMVQEEPARLDYLDALNVQVQASAVLLLGSTEPHYTPSKVFPALLAQRPLVAVYHEASSVVSLLREAAAGASIVTFGDDTAPESAVPQLIDALGRLVSAPQLARATAVCPGMHPWSARSLAGKLAGVLDTVSS